RQRKGTAMSLSPSKNATPVNGEVIERSLSTSIGTLLGCVLVFAFCALLVWMWFTGHTFDRMGDTESRVSWWGLIVGVLGVVAAPVFGLIAILTILAKQRLVFGSDRLQILNKDNSVALQIPYSNIDDIERAANVKIYLKDPDDPDTFGADFKANDKML